MSEYVGVEGARTKNKGFTTWVPLDAIEESCLTQAQNLCRLPMARAVALMPDAHSGYGMPVGGMLATEMAVVPYAIGVDIGCGMTLIHTDLSVGDLIGSSIEAFLHQVNRDVPTGPGPRGSHRYAEGEPFKPGRAITSTADQAIREAEVQLGTLGGGNHFLELQRDEQGNVYFMIHSGSRSVGKKICDYHHKKALELCTRWHSDLPDPEVAYLPWKTDEAQWYWNDMLTAMEWAEENRRRMAGKVISAIGKTWGRGAYQSFDVHHNFAAWENHYGENVIVHRKGAIRAQDGDQLLIPGSMSTGSYIAEGAGNPLSYNTAPHGSGRLRSRAATRKMVSLELMDQQLAEKGVVLVTDNRAAVVDESQAAYKDIESVIAAASDLIKPAPVLLTPLGVVKGGDLPRQKKGRR